MVPLAERMEILRSCRLVDEVVAETVPTKLEMWKQLGFHVIFKGDDWRGTPKGDELEQAFAAVGVDVVYFPYTIHTSSTLLRAVIEQIAAS